MADKIEIQYLYEHQIDRGKKKHFQNKEYLKDINSKKYFFGIYDPDQQEIHYYLTNVDPQKYIYEDEFIKQLYEVLTNKTPDFYEILSYPEYIGHRLEDIYRNYFIEPDPIYQSNTGSIPIYSYGHEY